MWLSFFLPPVYCVSLCCTASKSAAKCIPIEAEPYIAAAVEAWADGVVSSLCALKPPVETKFEAN